MHELGVYGGAGQSLTRAASAMAARVTVNPFGKIGYGSESDLDHSPKPLLSLGADYYGNTLKKTAAATFETNNITLAGASGWPTTRARGVDDLVYRLQAQVIF